MKKFSIFLIVLILTLAAAPAASAAYTDSMPEIDCEAALLMSTYKDMVIYHKNEDQRRPMASITKLTTAAVVFEHCPDLSAKVVCSYDAIHSLDGTDSSVAGLRPDEELTVEDLLYCLLLHSGNDAANVLAEYVAGSIPAFIDMMNEYAESIGCKDTHYMNAHGLDEEGHYTTCRDIIRIGKKLMENDKFLEISAARSYTVPETNKAYERELYTKNALLTPGVPDYYYSYAKGGKTGTTSLAGNCLFSYAEKDGYTYMCVVLGGGQYDVDGDDVDERMSFWDTKRLYKWAFDNLRLRTVVNVNDVVDIIDVRLSSGADHVSLVPVEKINSLVPPYVGFSDVLIKPVEGTVPLYVDAPVKQGDRLGRVRIYYAGGVIGEVDVCAADDVARDPVKFVAFSLYKLISQLWFKILLTAAALASIISYIITLRKSRRSEPITVIGSRTR